MIRDAEFKRLVLYAKGLGLKVTVFNRNNPHMQAYWTTDGKELGIYCGLKPNKTDLNLTIIHELGHALSYIRKKKRKTPQRLEKAWSRENDQEKLSESERKLIYEDEIAGVSFWDSIIQDTNVKIPKWRVELQKEIDLWIYEVYYKTGEYPKGKFKADTLKAFKAKWKARK